MRKMVLFGILIFIISVGIGVMYSAYLKMEENNSISKEENIIKDMEVYIAQNTLELETIETVSEDKKITPKVEFGIKYYYDECGHYIFKYEPLPTEIVNLTIQEIEDYYEEYEVETFEEDSLVLVKEINGYCDNHFMLKLADNMIEIYKLNSDGTSNLYEKSEIAKEYLTEEDIEQLEEGIYVYGESKINATLEDFE